MRKSARIRKRDREKRLVSYRIGITVLLSLRELFRVARHDWRNLFTS